MNTITRRPVDKLILSVLPEATVSEQRGSIATKYAYKDWTIAIKLGFIGNQKTQQIILLNSGYGFTELKEKLNRIK